MSLFTWWRDRYLTNRAEMGLDLRDARAGGFIPRWEQDKPKWLPNNTVQFDTKAYRKVALIFACIQHLASSAGMAPLKVFNRAGRDIPNHPMRDLIIRPNPLMGESRFISFITMNTAISGFTVIEKERGGVGNIAGLWPLRSDWIRPIPRNQEAPDWEYRVPGYESTPTTLRASDVIVITWADTPDWRFTGIGPLEVIFREAQISTALTEFLKVFMDRGAVPLYMLVPSDDLAAATQFSKQEVKDAFMAAWRQRYGGLQASMAEPLLSPGIKDVKRIGLDFNELAYPELNSLTDARICQAFGVPPIFVGAEVGLDASTFSNSDQAAQNFWHGTMMRLWSRIDDAFTRELMPEFETRSGFDVRFDMGDIPFFQEDIDALYSRITAAFTAGLISRTVAQNEIGIMPHGPDLFMIAGTPTPIDEIPLSTVERADLVKPAIPAGDDDDEPEDDEEPAAGERMLALAARIDAMERRHEDVASPPEPFVRQYVNVKAMHPIELEVRKQTAAKRRNEIIRHANHAQPILRSYFSEQKDRVIASVSGQIASGGRSVRAADIDWNDERFLLDLALHPWLREVGRSAFQITAAETNTADAWNVSNAWLERLDGQLAQRIVGITDVTRKDVELIVSQALHDGVSIPQLAEKLEELFEDTYAGRGATIARTESQVAFNTATTMGYEASGVVTHAQLHDNPLHTTEPGSDGLTCAQRNDLVVPLADVETHIAAEHPNGTLAVSAFIPEPE